MIYVFCFMPDVNSSPFLKKSGCRGSAGGGGSRGVACKRSHICVFPECLCFGRCIKHTSEGSQLVDKRLLFFVLFN